MNAHQSHLASNLIMAEKSVPRYTSYPTAPHFSDAVGPETASAWLGGLPVETRLSLYLHVPYCRELCNYCGCHTRATRQAGPLDGYAETLLREIDLVAKATPARTVIHAHWGGGTPSMLGGARLLSLTDALRSRFAFAPDAEVSIELDPRYVDAELVEALAACGVTRVSLGVQDFNPHVQKADRPRAAVRDRRPRRRTAARKGACRHQSRPDVRPAGPERGGCDPHRRTRGLAAAEPPRHFRLCPRALVRQAPEADRFDETSRRGRAPAPGGDLARDPGSPGLCRHRPRPFRQGRRPAGHRRAQGKPAPQFPGLYH